MLSFPTKFMVFMLCAVLLLIPVLAQDNLPILLDSNSVFTSPDLIESIEPLPLYIADQEQVSFYDDDSKAWHSYPYPEFPLEPDEIYTANFTQNPSGEYVLKVEYYTPCITDCVIDESAIDYTPPLAARVRERWHFDLNTGEFTAFESICSGYARAESGEGKWVFGESAEGLLRICNTETGQTSAPLPEIDYSTPLLKSPSLSPDGRWLVFTFYYDLAVWVYDFVEGTLTSLGHMTTTSPFTHIEFPKVDWIDDQHIIVQMLTVDHGDNTFYLYAADVSQGNSLELIYNSIRRQALKLDNPIRYLWVGKQFEDTESTVVPDVMENCTIHEYNPVDHTIESFYIQEVCSLGWVIPDGSGDHLALQQPYEDSTQRQFVRFSRDTHVYKIIPVGNFIGMAGLSPDGRYAVITIGSGQYDYQIAVLDLQSNLFLEPFYPTDLPFAYIEWVGNHTFWQNHSNDSEDRLFTISDTGLSVQSGRFYAPKNGASPDNRFLLMESTHGTLDVLNIETLETMTIAQIPDGASIGAAWEADGHITVFVWKDDYFAGALGRWRVRLNLNRAG